MNTEKFLAVLRLQATKSIGNIMAKKLIATVGSVEQIFEEKSSNLAKINGVGSLIISNLKDCKTLENATKELEYIMQNNINYCYFLNDDYPEYLKHCIDSPILFFKEGTINLNSKRIIAIVGTRNMTAYGKDFCTNLIAELKDYNPIIVSGFAYGVDICAHKAAIENNLQTIAVLAHGFTQIYPKVHKAYMAQVCNNGGFITEFWSNENPQRENFLKRNRIVAGLSKATIIIESGKKGGSLVTADIANSYNRDVFAVPGRVGDVYSIGCNNLIKNNQAHVLTEANDIVQMLNWDVAKVSPPKQKELFITLSKTEQSVFDYLQQNGKQHLDNIAFNCQIPIYKLSSLLLEMELKNIIKPLPGKLFEV